MKDIREAKAVARREAEKQQPRIGEPCEHFSGCKEPSKYAMGYWYPTPAGCVMCEEHVSLGRGDCVIPPHPKWPTGVAES